MRLPAAEGEHLASVTRISLRYQGEAAQTVERPEYAGLAADPLFAQGRFPVLNFDAHFIALLLRDQSLCVQSVVIVGQPELVKNRLLFSLSHPGFHFPVMQNTQTIPGTILSIFPQKHMTNRFWDCLGWKSFSRRCHLCESPPTSAAMSQRKPQKRLA